MIGQTVVEILSSIQASNRSKTSTQPLSAASKLRKANQILKNGASAMSKLGMPEFEDRLQKCSKLVDCLLAGVQFDVVICKFIH